MDKLNNDSVENIATQINNAFRNLDESHALAKTNALEIRDYLQAHELVDACWLYKTYNITQSALKKLIAKGELTVVYVTSNGIRLFACDEALLCLLRYKIITEKKRKAKTPRKDET